MKKKILCLLLAIISVISLLPITAFAAPAFTLPTFTAPTFAAPAFTLPTFAASTSAAPTSAASTSAAPVSLDDINFFVEKNADANLGGRVTIEFSKSSNFRTYSYSGTLYLPGNADAEQLCLSWDADGVTVKVNNTAYESGSAPIPAAGSSLAYTVTSGSNSATFTVNTLKGSEEVEGLFLDIDESQGTISAMNSDPDHETSCYGQGHFDATDYFISMKGRGNATWKQVKKPYNITFYKAADYNKKKSVSLIDGVESKKWSLLANYVDNTRLRNKIGYDLADALGVGLDSRFVDVWMNGEYLGNYLLTPKSDYEVKDNGFILELDNYKEPEGGDPQFTLNGLTETTATGTTAPRYNRFSIKATGDDLTMTNDDIHAWMEDAWAAIRNTSSDEYLDYIDLDSWAKMYLLNELFKNYDIIAGSILMHRDGTSASDKLIAGPVWDLDNALGRVNVCPHNGVSDSMQLSADGWYIDSVGENKFQNRYAYVCWFQELGKHESFMKRVYSLYDEYAETIESIYDAVDINAAIIDDSMDLEAARWGTVITDANDYISRAVTYGSGSYAIKYIKTNNWSDSVTNLKTYLEKRLNFLSDNLTVASPESGFITGHISVTVGDTLRLSVVNVNADSYQWQSSSDGVTWTDISGATAQTYSAIAQESMDNLQFRCEVTKLSSVISTKKVAKVAPGASAVCDAVTVKVSPEGSEYQVCVEKRALALSNGELIFSLGGQEIGTYTFAASGSGWTILGEDGKYLGFKNNAFTYSDTPFVWTYSNGAFQTSVTTTTGWGFMQRTVTTTYYLVCTGDNFTVSTSTAGSAASFAVNVEALEHTFGPWTVSDNGHNCRTCSVCGFVEYEKCCGDLNGDMSCDSNDVWMLYHIVDQYDLDTNGQVDRADAVLLMQYSMLPELYPLSAEYVSESVVPGDLDGDMKCNSNDVALILDTIDLYDFDKNGQLDHADTVLLMQHSALPELYPLGA